MASRLVHDLPLSPVQPSGIEAIRMVRHDVVRKRRAAVLRAGGRVPHPDGSGFRGRMDLPRGGPTSGAASGSAERAHSSGLERHAGAVGAGSCRCDHLADRVARRVHSGCPHALDTGRRCHDAPGPPGHCREVRVATASPATLRTRPRATGSPGERGRSLPAPGGSMSTRRSTAFTPPARRRRRGVCVQRRAAHRSLRSEGCGRGAKIGERERDACWDSRSVRCCRRGTGCPSRRASAAASRGSSDR